MSPTSITLMILTNLLLVSANEDMTTTESYSVESTSRQNPGKSDIWIRKMRTYFLILDFDGDGVVCRDDFDRMAQRFADLENFDPEQRNTARQLLSDLFSLYTNAAGRTDDGLMTQDLLMRSVYMQSDGPMFRKTLDDALLSLFTPMKISQEGHLNYDEYRRLYEDIGFVDTRFTEAAFPTVDTNHDGKVSFEEYLDAAYSYMCSDDENSTAMFGLLV